MGLNIETVRAMLLASQAAWNSGSIEGVLEKYVDDLVYITNAGGPNGETLRIEGKDNLRRRLRASMDACESQARIDSVREDRGLIRTRLSAVIRHKASGHTINLSLRQILRLEGFRIAEQVEYHDAAKLAAFWRLAGDTRGERKDPASVG
mgnify:CR=1 FL=1